MIEGPAHNTYIVLASSSPRRAEILTSLGIPFLIDPSRVPEEIAPGESAREAAQRLAAAKAAEVAPRHAGKLVLAADTLVLLGDVILGKPRDDADAARMLRLLSGKRHRVVTAIRLRSADGPGRALVAESAVDMAPISPEELAWYVGTGEPRDKAGAYAVQGLGARFIEGVEGSYSNVMGLPARGVYLLMKAAAGDGALALPVPSSL
ncbi:MAG TPA: Maf family protein [Thermoanaerobaculia bacterium]|nr:Maf family protein [Thermoanaerobaculia bacterium]